VRYSQPTLGPSTTGCANGIAEATSLILGASQQLGCEGISLQQELALQQAITDALAALNGQLDDLSNAASRSAWSPGKHWLGSLLRLNLQQG